MNIFDENNKDGKTIESFGSEWTRYSQNKLKIKGQSKAFNDYFSIFPFSSLKSGSIGLDIGAGSGRWAKYLLERGYCVDCLEPSNAFRVAAQNLKQYRNTTIINQTLAEYSLNSQVKYDFAYSLGVLHHMPMLNSALNDCISLLKPKAPFLAYIYYSLDNKNSIFRALWNVSDFIRRFVSRLPLPFKIFTCEIIALFIYWPIIQICRTLRHLGLPYKHLPLSYYIDHGYYTLRTDSFDRFATPLEKRYSRSELKKAFEDAGFVNIVFRESAPYWCIMGFKRD